MKKYSNSIQKVVRSRWIRLSVRLGYLIRGLLYGIVGFLTIELVLGMRSDAMGTTEVISSLSRIHGGTILVLLVIVGLLGYAMWSLIRAFLDKIDPVHPQQSFFHRIGYLFSAGSYLLLILPSITVLQQKQIHHSPSMINKLLMNIVQIPFGNILIIGVGLATIGGGLFQIVKAVRAKKPSDLWSDEDRKPFRIFFMVFAKIGIAVRGMIFTLVGFFFILAGVQTNPTEIKSIDGVITAITYMPYGYILLSAIGVGLIFFGIYSTLLSLWIDLPE